MLAKIIATDPAVPGEAQLLIRLRGVTDLVESLEFALLNNQQNYLQEGDQWSPAPHWFSISGGYPLQSGSGFRVGAAIVDPLLVNQSPIQLHVKLASGEDRHTTLQVAREAVLPSSARGEVGEYGGSSVISTPVVEAPQVPELAPVGVPVEIELPAFSAEPEPEPEVEAEPEPVPVATPLPMASTAAPKSKTPLILGGVVLLLLLGALIFWFSRPADAPSAAAPVTDSIADTAAEPVTDPTAETAAELVAAEPVVNEASGEATDDGCSATNLATKSELAFVQACIAEQPPTDALLAVIQNAKSAQKCGVAQRLYANRAQGGDSKVALAYAREYDPKFHQSNDCFKEADNATAAYWYDTALQVEPDNAEAKQRYEELSK
ncbi:MULTISPECIES: hypothetical protein [Aeromonas]|jgi:hypothetical protein|uniref:Uncharacterized protein n=2 Tax=Aeromonas TaxID=642 RepID=A0AAE7AHE8_AERME|nr:MULTISPECIES: hypothetical protein [Aeromonas]MCV9384731.1 hypothetical protein [Aeromonas hydrophila]MDE8810984.1 hypothetical protein [Aeromonas hydrophila]QJT31444.1 hypothetical protein E4186_15495 [Aeromonas media]WEE27218.1 hypothetical protein PY771_02585 [Aeromonas hydrophila]